MEVAEFLVVTCASSLTLAIIGVFKEVTILTLAVIIKGNEITFINLCGMVICLLGIFAHVIRKTIKGQLISKYSFGVFCIVDLDSRNTKKLKKQNLKC